jgi:hypothetical protein
MLLVDTAMKFGGELGTYGVITGLSPGGSACFIRLILRDNSVLLAEICTCLDKKSCRCRNRTVRTPTQW